MEDRKRAAIRRRGVRRNEMVEREGGLETSLAIREINEFIKGGGSYTEVGGTPGGTGGMREGRSEFVELFGLEGGRGS